MDRKASLARRTSTLALLVVSLSTPPALKADEQGTIPLQPTPGSVYLTLLTSMFMHGSLMHLLGNMLFLWIAHPTPGRVRPRTKRLGEATGAKRR